MFPEVWQRIAVREFASLPATLPGFAIYRVKEALFPGIVRAEPADQVHGKVYLDLDEDSLFELDAYESDLYERRAVVVAAEHGPLECTAYVIPESNRRALTSEVWDAEWFRQHQLAKYLHG